MHSLFAERKHIGTGIKGLLEEETEDLEAGIKALEKAVPESDEKSVTLPEACEARFELVVEDGTVKVLKDKLPLLKGEVTDPTFMNCKILWDVLFSLHIKATMMQISDPIMIGHCVKAY